MNIEKLMNEMNADFLNKRDDLVNSFMKYGQENNQEKLLDFCEELEEMRTWGEVSETLVEMEICEPFDLPYLLHILINTPTSIAIFFDEA